MEEGSVKGREGKREGGKVRGMATGGVTEREGWMEGNSEGGRVRRRELR